ncbi:hypothetical protein QNI16_34185 [Cytophagaceae bacterium YF14B1]|uniref:Uncharacterized protein n=1 Tax=Xanthocytophaga flava TaxID=3048013 RepID=A0AAE3QYN8_9BACT|nr:hypothetical protein [Xanthocytophaga flavus]MDJ1485590.1 hypothetical protein [Xanthocytophaga flavus]
MESKRKVMLLDVEEDIEQLSGNQMDAILGGKPIFTQTHPFQVEDEKDRSESIQDTQK